MKKLLLSLSVVALTASAFAWYRGPRHYWHGGCHHHHHGWHADDFWVGAGVGLVGGLVGAAVYNAVKPDPPRVVVQPQPVVVQSQPIVVQQPVVVQQPAPVVVQQQPAPVVVQQQPVMVQQVAPPSVQTIWIPGRYVSQTQANGTVVQVWQPGHYEQR